MESIRELIEKRNKLAADMRTLVTLAETREGPDQGVMTPEQETQFNAMDDEMEKISAQIERRQKVEAAERLLAESSNKSAPPALENRARNPMSPEARKAGGTRSLER